MRKVVTNMLVSIRLPVLSLDCNGRVFTLYFAHYLLAGRWVFFFITIWSWKYLARRSHGVPTSKYIDDRHIRQLLVQSPGQPWHPASKMLRQRRTLCYLFVEAGYFANIAKSLSTFVNSLVSSVILSSKHSSYQKERNSYLRCLERTFWNPRRWHWRPFSVLLVKLFPSASR